MRVSAIIAGVLFAVPVFAVQSQVIYAQSSNNQMRVVASAQATPRVVVAQASPPAKATAPIPPKPEPKMVEVQEGDFLSKIATDNGTTYTRLFDANENLTDPDVIHPGDKLRIPTADEQLASRPLPEKVAPAPVVQQQSVAPTPRRQAVSAPAPVTYADDGSVWDALARCESGGNWAINTGNGFYGGLQFTLSSWHGVGGSGYPNEASREEQISRGQMLQARQGWGAWPACSAKLGLR